MYQEDAVTITLMLVGSQGLLRTHCQLYAPRLAAWQQRWLDLYVLAVWLDWVC